MLIQRELHRGLVGSVYIFPIADMLSKAAASKCMLRKLLVMRVFLSTQIRKNALGILFASSL
jgi:hypothetical protein